MEVQEPNRLLDSKDPVFDMSWGGDELSGFEPLLGAVRPEA